MRLTALLFLLLCCLSPTVKAEPKVVKGPFQLVQTIEESVVAGKLDADKVLRLPFPDLPWGSDGYKIRYTCVLAAEVPGGLDVGDCLDIRAAVTVMQRPFIDFRTKKPGSAFCPSEIRICDDFPPDDGEIYGLRAGRASGENINGEGRSYYVVEKNTLFHAKKKMPKCVVAFYLYPASQGAKKGQYLSIPTTSDYNRLYVRHERLLGQPLPPPVEPPAEPEPEPAPKEEPWAELLKLHNEERGLRGRESLALSPTLTTLAQRQATWMASERRLSHQDGEGRWPWDRAAAAGYAGLVSENIAEGTRTNEETFRAWLSSRGHRNNLLDRRWTEVGFGMAEVNGRKYWCAVFGDGP